MKRLFKRGWKKLPWWARLGALLLTPLISLNLAVGFFGNSLVSPLSPFFLREKASALREYAAHRPGCLLAGHDDVEQLVREAEVKHGVPKGLMRAVVMVESGQRPHRISAAGAMGLAQLMPGTAKQLGVTDAFDSHQSIDAGARYLAAQLKRTGNVELALASYNAGPGAVRGGQVPRNGETEFYVAKVLRAYRR